ncbi:MAG TPA: hypothetical protein PK659_04830 [Methanothrix sp.]|nr:hypothetical protein [Methanothrix sp.]HOK58238.1 hypothetical protein [Methanothrix sp.]HOL43562.1 hypothetical protein [Methanothrix sp.]HPO89149.1 hypothetical protein [Methanothrix sp.]
MEEVLYISVPVSVAAAWIATRKWICKAPEVGLLGWDMHKPGRPKVPEMGGVPLVFGFVLGVLVYIGIETFYLHSYRYTPTLAALCTVLMACIIGMMDDLLGWKAGLKQWQKPVFMFFAAMPMMVINAGQTTMTLPLLGRIDWGILYPLVIVPVGIVGASNAFNMVAGYNGLEAGMGVIIFSALGYVGLNTGKTSAAALSLMMLGALLALLYFNRYPARVFPGDTMTYSVGALAACVAILGDMERVAVTLFVPYAIDFFLQARGRFGKEAFAKLEDDGSLSHTGIYHLTHVALAVLKRLKGRVYERDVVLFMWGLEAVVALLSIYAYL